MKCFSIATDFQNKGLLKEEADVDRVREILCFVGAEELVLFLSVANSGCFTCDCDVTIVFSWT